MFPPLNSIPWQQTRPTLQTYAKFLGGVRRALTPPQPHWQHISLRVDPVGLITTAIPIPDSDGKFFMMMLDLRHHKLSIANTEAARFETSLQGQNPQVLIPRLLDAMFTLGIQVDVDPAAFANDTGSYDRAAAETYLQAITAIDDVFQRFRAKLAGQSTSIQLWPHHFDLSLTWFSGRLVPGIDPADEENAAEQMGFGFVPGDEGIPEPYFYITAYPWPERLAETRLPAPARWQSEGWNGAVLPYAALTAAAHADEFLLDFLRTVQRAGAAFMLG